MTGSGSFHVTTPSDREIAMTRVFEVPRQLVFEAITQPELVSQWLLGPPGWSMPVCEIDLRVGGKYRYVWRHQNGKEMASGGEFREIVPPARLVATERFEDLRFATDSRHGAEDRNGKGRRDQLRPSGRTGCGRGPGIALKWGAMKPVFALLFSAAILSLPVSAQVKVTSGGDKVSVEINGKPFTDFYAAGTAFGAEVTKPYLWPLRAPSGTYVTRQWPMEMVAEEEKTLKDHQHQRGLWFAHDTVNKLDFWNNEASYKTPNRGRITLQKMGELKSGKEKGSIAATFDWRDMAGERHLLTESRVMTFYADKAVRIFDLDITLTAKEDVTFGDGKDGVLGIRLRPVLQEIAQRTRATKDKPAGSEEGVPGTGKITNADGMASEKEVWGKPSNWCDYSGEVAGEKVGIAILDNPENPRHPVRWHARGYGLFAANPFGLAVFTNDKSQDGSISIKPGQSLRYRYRIIIHPGDVKSADIAAAWTKYTGK